MEREKVKICVMLCVVLFSGVMALGTTISYTDDFSAWTKSLGNASDPYNPGYDFPEGAWHVTDNSTALSWDQQVTAGAAYPRWSRYSITVPETITSIEFDWRFANDTFYDRLNFNLLDGAGNVLWSATSTGGGVPKPLNLDTVVATNTNTLTFEYKQTDVIYGVAGLFTANQDDWDAFVDNVTLTTIPEPATMILLSVGIYMAAKKRIA